MDDSDLGAAMPRRSFLVGGTALLLYGSACSDDQSAGVSDSPATSSGAGASDASGGDDQATDGDTTAEDPSEAEDPSKTEPEDPSEAEPTEPAMAPLAPEAFAAVAVCALTPTQAAGPFPTIDDLERRDITEGYPGHPLRLGLRVVDRDCQPVPGARVEIWHTDASGDYSSYEDGGDGKDEGEGTTFLRGSQVADGDGIVEFQTIYPGWYGGRAVHIHAIVTIDDRAALTTQLYFDEGYTEVVLASGEYAQFGPPDTPWADDRIVGDPTADGSGIVLVAAPTPLGQGTLGLVNLGIDI